MAKLSELAGLLNENRVELAKVKAEVIAFRDRTVKRIADLEAALKAQDPDLPPAVATLLAAERADLADLDALEPDQPSPPTVA